MSDYLDSIETELDNIRGEATRLGILANALFTAGNHYLASQLRDVVRTLEATAIGIDGAVSAEVRRQHDVAMQSSINVVQAALAGSKMSEGGL